jgi:hypothetical protein
VAGRPVPGSEQGRQGLLPSLRSLRLRLAATAGAAALIASGLAAGLVAPPASAAAGNPGVPSDGTLVYQEDFQNAPVTGATRIADYTSSSGATYTAGPGL